MNCSKEVWNEYHNRLLLFIRKRVSPEDAEDILQDVFLKVHQKTSSLKDNSKIESWLYQVTRNTIVDYYRVKTPPADINTQVSEFKIE